MLPATPPPPLSFPSRAGTWPGKEPPPWEGREVSEGAGEGSRPRDMVAGGVCQALSTVPLLPAG